MCPVHTQRQNKELALEDVEFHRDLSRGHESIPVTMQDSNDDPTRVSFNEGSKEEATVKEGVAVICGECSTVGSSGGDEGAVRKKRRFLLSSLSEFTYITQNVDSDATHSAVRNTNKLPCCDCEGMCDDPQTCACLQVSRVACCVM